MNLNGHSTLTELIEPVIVKPADAIDVTPGNFAYPCGPYSVFRITPTDPESLKFLPRLHVRALEFCEKYGSDTDPVWLAQLLYNNFKNPQTQNLVHILIAVDTENNISAHSISYVDTYGALGPVAMWLQTEKNEGIELDDWKQITELAQSLVKEWMRSLKIKTALAYALTPALARLDRLAGFRLYRSLTRMDLD